MHDPSSLRNSRIMELVAYARRESIAPNSIDAFDRLWRYAQYRFFVRDVTARDYAKAAVRVLRDLPPPP
jgi:hypothetical protein